RSHQIERAVGEVRDSHEPEDQGESAGHQEQEGAEAQPVEHLLELKNCMQREPPRSYWCGPVVRFGPWYRRICRLVPTFVDNKECACQGCNPIRDKIGIMAPSRPEIRARGWPRAAFALLLSHRRRDEKFSRSRGCPRAVRRVASPQFRRREPFSPDPRIGYIERLWRRSTSHTTTDRRPVMSSS